MKEDKGTLKVTVRDGSGRHAPIKGALVLVSAPRAGAKAKTSWHRRARCRAYEPG